jgi:hypothetical protein
MTRDEFLAFHDEFTAAMRSISSAKNHDYTGGKDSDDAFKNFRTAEFYGLCSKEVGLMTRLLDKVSRVSTLLGGHELKVQDEKIHETLLDLSNYSVILAAMIKERGK